MKTIRSSLKMAMLAVLLTTGFLLSATPSQADVVFVDHHRGYYDSYHRFHRCEYWHNHYGYWRSNGIFISID